MEDRRSGHARRATGGTRRARRLGGLALALLGLAVLAIGVDRGRERGAMRGSFPLLEGRLALEGLGAPLEIVRDVRGVAHVEAQDETDAYFALGFVHAQDRLAQMQWLLRLASGRTAELLGEEGLPADRLARTLDLAGVAEREARALDADTRRRLEAYARGVNARIARVQAGEARPPLAAARLGMPLDPWRPEHSLAVLKYYAWALSASLDASLVLDDLLGALGGVGARRFFPEPAGQQVIPLRPPVTARVGAGQQAVALRPPVTANAGAGHGAMRTSRGWRDPLRRAAGLAGSSAGSSAWVLGGAHTQSGRPLLAADAHLEPTVPALLYVLHVRGGELDVAGATVPGVPAFWTGHNRTLAWASTHARAAVTDLYNEMLHPDGEPSYHDGRGWQPLDERVESIAVAGDEARTLTVRRTHHGPLVNDLLGSARDPLAIAWVGLTGRGAESMRALLALPLAANADALLAALADLAEPALAMVYADADGAAGLQVAGWIPQRPLATGLVPVPGRASWYDWSVRIPFAQLPARRLSEGRGWAIAADNRLTPHGREEDGEWLWRSGARAERIAARLRAAVDGGPVSLRDLAALQTDVRDERGLGLVRAALDLLEDGTLSPEATEVAKLLQGWNGSATPESQGAAAYHVFLVVLTGELFRDPLGEELLRRYLSLPQADPAQVVSEIVGEAAAGGEPGGWSDRERVAEAVRRSLRGAWFQLSYKLGASRGKWRWGRLHRVAFRPFAPGWEGAAEPLGPYESGGSGVTVNTAEYALDLPYAVRLASTFRFAVDAAGLDRSLTALAPGQSEHPGHPHYADGVPPWLDGDSSVLMTSRLLIDESSRARLLLEPAP